MDSPILIQLLKKFPIDVALHRPLYLQFADKILELIKQGKLQSGQKLPSTRELAIAVGINRVTISKAFTELQLQGWLESFVGKGTFVSAHIPEFKPAVLTNDSDIYRRKTAGFEIDDTQHLPNPFLYLQQNCI